MPNGVNLLAVLALKAIHVQSHVKNTIKTNFYSSFLGLHRETFSFVK